MRHYAKGIQTASEALDELDEYVNEILDSDSDWVDMKKYCTRKGEGVESLTKREAIRAILREKVDIVNKSFEPLKTLAPKIVKLEGDAPSYGSLEELESLIEEEEKKQKIRSEDEED